MVRDVFHAEGLPYPSFVTSLMGLRCEYGRIVDKVASIVGVDIKGYLKEMQPYLTHAQVAKVMSEGFTVGSHSRRHYVFSRLPLSEQVDEVKESLRILQEHFGRSSRVFAFPHTDDGVKHAFYREVRPYVDLTFGTAGMVRDSASQSI